MNNTSEILIIAIKSCSNCSGHKNKKCFTSKYNKKELINIKTCFNYKICIYDKALQLSIGSRSNKENDKNTLKHFAIAIATSRMTIVSSSKEIKWTLLC